MIWLLHFIWKNNIQCNVLHVLPNSNIEEEICEFPSFLGFLILWIFTWKKSYSTMKSFWWFHFLIIGFAEKRCTENGTWYLNSDHSEWTNFTTCGQTDVHLKQEYVHVILYGFSVIALTPAIIIFFAYKYVVAEDKFFENNLLHFYTNAKSFPHFIFLFLQSIESSTNCHPQKFICLPIAILRFYDYIQMCHILAIYSRFESSSTVWKCWFVYYWRLSTGIVYLH